MSSLTTTYGLAFEAYMLMSALREDDITESGDHIALGEALERLYPRVYRAVAGITAGTGLDVDDLTQEAFLKAYRNINHFRGESSLYTWTYRIARNVCLDAMRRRKYRGQFIFDWFRQPDSDHDFPDPSANDVAENRDTRFWIDKALAKLPEDYRSVIVFREIQDLSYVEISQIMDIPEGTVKSRLFKARKMMREQLEQYGVTP
jgi:RNA polymerase sigma-70 factor, ECF subfamily